ncbi:MAG: large conductance mechanosensitive channel protein MscL, partial [Clostridia bacterium]|nr:large conductance mechanosensitive channel protein MscL [Clostridia bacterium]
MKKFFKEFGEFIKRGNVLDLAVGVIIGGAFTAIITALTTHILRPLINWIIVICVGDTATNAYTFLRGSAADLENAIYIDWGAFISAIINFLLVALVLFIIIKFINHVAEELNINKRMKEAVTEKMKKGEELTSLEKRWIKRMEKKHPEMVPTLEEPAPEPAPE